ncbi:MAG: ABC transporter permease [Caldilineaceae bacterium]|nr:ABC transporter permease [Caldilineaceae bacterium]
MQVLTTFLKDLKIMLRDRGEMVSLFLTPLAFIIPICLAFPEDGYNLNADQKPRLPVATYDLVDGVPGEHAQALLDTLAESYELETALTPEEVGQYELGDLPECAAPGPTCDEAVGRGLVLRDSRAVAVVIPAGLSADVDAGQNISVTLLYNPASDPTERQRFEGVISGSTMRLSIENQIAQGLGQFRDLIEIAPDALQDEISRTAEEAEADATTGETTETRGAAISVVSVKPANSALMQSPNTLQQTIPGYTVMFVYFLIGTVAASVRMERNSGMLRRLLATPATRSAVLGGKTLATLLIGVLQVAVLFAIGAVVFGLKLGNDLTALLILTVAVVLSAVCIGLAAAAYRVERGITLPLIVAALLAGCAFPVDWLPSFLRTVNLVLPQTWAMQGYQDIITRGLGFADILPETGVLVGIAAVFFVLAVRRFDWEE